MAGTTRRRFGLKWRGNAWMDWSGRYDESGLVRIAGSVADRRRAAAESPAGVQLLVCDADLHHYPHLGRGEVWVQ
ncbi:MAG: hypothetical protein IPL86_11955 [Flavobacteriales bacterium]|nr:hypothetical protein [Flavobacteriales bacterium]